MSTLIIRHIIEHFQEIFTVLKLKPQLLTGQKLYFENKLATTGTAEDIKECGGGGGVA